MILRGKRLAALTASAAVAAGLFLLDIDPGERAPQGARTALVPPPAQETVSLGTAAEAATQPQAAAPAAPYDRTFRVGKGDTLMAVLVDAGIARREAHAAITELTKVFNPRRLKPGQEITVTYTPAADADAQEGAQEGTRLAGLTLAAAVDRDFVVRRIAPEGGFAAEEIEKVLQAQPTRAGGTIRASLYEAALEAGLPMPVLMDLIRAYSWDVDFQRDIQPGDGFEVLYESLLAEDGTAARHGDILYAALTLSGKRYPIYLFEGDGEHGYFDDEGRSAQKALMRTPINGARLSSQYGMRKHPILGYSRMHRGVDFAAPTGTPIYAAGDGVVDRAGRNGAYGKYVRIRHNSEFSTAYAHMSRIAVNRGQRVRQGEVIGYVGSTGRSTGAHLHYEILKKGSQTNPLKVKMPAGRQLKGETMAAFKARRDSLERLFASLPGETTVAQSD